MKPWKVIRKWEERADRDSVSLKLEVERNGARRTVTVSGATYYPAVEGGMVDLPLHSGTSEEKVVLVSGALLRVLIRAGAISKDAQVDEAALLTAADQYCDSPPATLPSGSSIDTAAEIRVVLGLAVDASDDDVLKAFESVLRADPSQPSEVEARLAIGRAFARWANRGSKPTETSSDAIG